MQKSKAPEHRAVQQKFVPYILLSHLVTFSVCVCKQVTNFGICSFYKYTFVCVTMYIKNDLLHECVYWHMHLKTIQIRETP